MTDARAIGYGRKLIEWQRHKFAHALAAPRPALAAPASTVELANTGFDRWFFSSFEIPMEPSTEVMASFLEWTASYAQHCARHQAPMLAEAGMMAAIRAYASANNCLIDEQTGDFLGARLNHA